MMGETASALRHGLLAALGALALGACGSLGDAEALQEASELAIDCQHDRAIAALDEARASGGVSAYRAGLEKVVILRDAGRNDAADKALEAWNADLDTASENRDDSAEAIRRSLETLRDKRWDKTGSRTCP